MSDAALAIRRFSSLSLRCSADVRFDVWFPRGEVEVCLAEISKGLATLAIPFTGGGAPNEGKELSSKSGARTEVESVSRQRLVVVCPTRMGFLNQGNRSFSVFLVENGPLPTGVTGVVSREVNCDRSLGEGEWLSGGGLSVNSNIDFGGAISSMMWRERPKEGRGPWEGERRWENMR